MFVVVSGLKWSSAVVPFDWGSLQSVQERMAVPIDNGKEVLADAISREERGCGGSNGPASLGAFQWPIDVGSPWSPKCRGNLPSVCRWRSLHRPLELCEIAANNWYQVRRVVLYHGEGTFSFMPTCHDKIKINSFEVVDFQTRGVAKELLRATWPDFQDEDRFQIFQSSWNCLQSRQPSVQSRRHPSVLAGGKPRDGFQPRRVCQPCLPSSQRTDFVCDGLLTMLITATNPTPFPSPTEKISRG